MTISETREKILTDDDFVLSEVKKLQYLIGLKRVTRYDLNRAEDDLTESVAEHVCGLLFLAQYFLRIEDCASTLDKNLVFDHILFHDTDELETGDVPTNHKTDGDRQEARQKLPYAISQSPEILQTIMKQLDSTYESQSSSETKFVKGLDKLEGVIHCYQERHRPIFQHLKFTEADQVRTKQKYIQPFPIMYRFYEVISQEYKRKDFFYQAS